jgi:1-acyl-sn-glycerol-3-phosphate acyltransferase
MNDSKLDSSNTTELSGASLAGNVAVIAAENNAFASRLLNELRQLQPDWSWQLLDCANAQPPGPADIPATNHIFIPPTTTRDGMTPDLREARTVFEKASSRPSGRFVLLSSALVYGTGPGRQALVSEEYPSPRTGESAISDAWVGLEALASEYLDATRVTILRPAIAWGWPALFTRLLSRRFVVCLPGHDPSLQFLSFSDLAAAVLCALRADKPGTFNVAPDGVMPLHAAIRLSGGLRVPIPHTLQRIIRKTAALDFRRYPWTVSNAHMKEELGHVPGKSIAAALTDFWARKQTSTSALPQFDEFGMDKAYIDFYSKSLFTFLSDYYWRIEEKGLEHVPRQGAGVLVGMHRGFMPWDGVMALHTLARRLGRYPRFLTHPGLLKFPFIANFVTRLGGVVASQESAGRVLGSGELLGFFPEGVRGAFTPYREAYKLQAFGRDAFVKVALRHRAPIIPFVTVGSVEAFPIFGKIKWRRWTRYADWPFIPITIPFPLPSKWHTEFLPPISLDQYSPESADDPATVKAISLEVRARMQQAVNEMLRRRRSIFFGPIFEQKRDKG